MVNFSYILVWIITFLRLLRKFYNHMLYLNRDSSSPKLLYEITIVKFITRLCLRFVFDQIDDVLLIRIDV